MADHKNGKENGSVEITAKMVQELREKTGAGMMDCKKALAECGGDPAKAEEILRKKGLAAAQKRAGRIASEGAVGSYVHLGGKIGVLVEVNCETDFVARNQAFQALVKDLAMHVAAMAPLYVRREEVPAELLRKELEIALGQAREQKKPEAIIEKIATGKLEKFYEQSCLMEQPFVRDDKKKVQDVLNEAVAKLGENIQVRRFARFVCGEGLERKSEDYAAEVARVAGLEK
ncbi:MAG TPA: translation elongation factor Ts [Anaeromyxobacteraceae bacterium]